uniref:NADH-ubiquinone oxidoreductase chain 4 n=1 Tax=Neochauliodes punctatolosus TaxID=1204440 RepID=K4GG87_NEOPN|nr:NADH dehydrogenase subunit 4 [Neochauliodes punctatolosus]AFN10583.1 NADH dehydrogenase subunit 4 [Neochauliodes punctatolosus]
MLKFLMFIGFLIPLCFNKKNFWVVQNLLLMLTFFFMLHIVNTSLYEYISYFFGMDLLSYGLILLSLWIISLMIMASESVYKNGYLSGFFLMNIIFLLMMLYLSFSSLSLFGFYLFFESSLIPTLILILGWGYQPERLQAGIYLLFYTLFASLPMLIAIMFMGNESSLYMYMFSNYEFLNWIFYLSMIFAFLVKMPMFLVHLWLPKAHVEAPVSGSMILAGILLKLGGYGLLRVILLISHISLVLSIIWIIISLFGGFIVSMICLRQVDLKSLIAYSSVAHMGIVLAGLMTLSSWGWSGSYSMMIAHGLCSSGLFCLANISYERMGSRSLFINKGMLNLMPSLCLWWFLLVSSNMAAPPSLNLLGEISLINSILGWSIDLMYLLMLISFFSAVYSLYLYSYSQHGKFYAGMYSSFNGYNREFLLLFLHWFPLNMLILKSEICMLWL